MRQAMHGSFSVRAALFALLLLGAGLVKAQFAPLTESAVYDPATGRISFSVLFNQLPDFWTVDEFGREANAFQYYIVSGQQAPYPYTFASIIRQEAAYFNAGLILVRLGGPSSPDPESGGWGEIVGSAPFVLDGPLLEFQLPFEILNKHGPYFSYYLQTLEYGRHISQEMGTVVAIDEPPAVQLIAAGLALMLVAYHRRSRSATAPGSASTRGPHTTLKQGICPALGR